MTALTAELNAPAQEELRDESASIHEPAPPPIGRMAAAALAGGALAACGGGGGTSSAGSSLGTASSGASNFAYATPASDQEAARFLLQAQFSASDAEVAVVRSQGYAGWLKSQMAISNGQSGTAWLDSEGYSVPDSNRNYFNPSYADPMIWNQILASPDAPRRRMALALSEIFVASTDVMTGYWPHYVMARYWDVLCMNAFGNYRTLLEAITLNLAMGNFLNTRGNKKADGHGSAPDENYAREVMQLFSIGLVLLNLDGTPKLDANGATISTYSNADITEVAKVFTGYDTDYSQSTVTTPIVQPGGGTDNVPNTVFTQLPMVQVQNSRYHSPESINFFQNVPGLPAVSLPAGTSAAVALKTTLDALFNHPNNPPFISKQLIQRLVTSNPSPAYVQRVASIYVNNGQGLRGDLAAVYAAILQDDEARGPSALTGTQSGKLREPMVRFTQWARTFGVSSISGGWKLGDLSDAGTRLGQSPLRSPTVFNFFRPGYVLPGTTALAAGAVVPEFQLVNESSVAGYLNFMQTTIDTGITYYDSATNSNILEFKAAYTAEIALAESPTRASPGDLINRINLLLSGGQLSAATVTTITTAVGTMAGTVTGNATQTATNLRKRVCATVLMVMASAEYLIQK